MDPDATQDSRVKLLVDNLQNYSDFPKPGILFWDIFSLLNQPKYFSILIEVLVERIKKNCPNIDVISGLDSRGFIFASPICLALGKPFVPIRKKGKLPGDVETASYSLEYGKDAFEVQKASIKPGDKVLLLDDLLATGGSMKAACELITVLGAHVSLCLVCIELKELKGREKIKHPVDSIISI